MHAKLRRLGRTALALAPVAALAAVAAWAGAASAATGSLEICKSSANGAAGVGFAFTVKKLPSGSPQTVTVTGGTCSSPISAATGKWQVTESLAGGLWKVAGSSVQPAGALVRAKDSAGWVKVKVTAGSDTQVTITDAPTAATLKVCKWSSSPALQGKSFSFTIGATTTVTATAGTSKASPGCSGAMTVQPGSRLKVTEAVPDGEKVAGITVSSNATLTSSNGGIAKVTVGSGANVVTYDDEPVGPPQTGYVEVCKEAADRFVSGSFTFAISDSAGLHDTEQVQVGQCTGPIRVAAGNVDVAETGVANTHVDRVDVVPVGRQGPVNLTNGAATVTVPVSATPAGETQVTFVDAADLATLKVCKVLTASSGDLAGTSFHFGLTTAAGTDGLDIVASTGANGACKQYGTSLPVGSQVAVTEAAAVAVAVNGGPPGVGATSVTTLGPGINTVTFANQAYGRLEVCKQMQVGDEPFEGTVFSFAVNGGKPFDVAAGRCSQPMLVPAGTATVSEAVTASFSFVSSTATGPTGADRVVSGANPVVVSVPYAGAGGNETLVRFTNKVQRARVKICKTVEPGSPTALGKLTFDYLFVYAGDVNPDVETPSVEPGTCTGLLGDPDGLPVVNTDGSPALVTVVEYQDPALYQVHAIVVQNGAFWPFADPNPDLSSGTAIVNPSVGVVVITYTNASSPAS